MACRVAVFGKKPAADGMDYVAYICSLRLEKSVSPSPLYRQVKCLKLFLAYLHALYYLPEGESSNRDSPWS